MGKSQRSSKAQVKKTKRVGSGSDNSQQVNRSAGGNESVTVHRSATTGRFVSPAAASRLPRSTIEATGFSPTDVPAIPDHDIREAFQKIMLGDRASDASSLEEAVRLEERTNEALLVSITYFVDKVRRSGIDHERAGSILFESADLLQTPDRSASVLTAAQADFAVRSGAMTAEEFAEAEAMVASGELDEMERKTRLEAVTEALSTAEVATKLGRDQSRIRDRAGKGQLYSFLVGGKRLFPKWQFTDDAKQEVLPGLAALVKGIPEDMHASSVLNFMATPQEDLLIDDEEVTPTEWLRLGRPPQDVVDILDSFLQS
jgi:DNA-directed RNA polymerase specialized sigma24 family protein